MTIKNLQNGSDIRGIALSGIAGETPNLGQKETFALSYGFVRWLENKRNKPAKTLKLAVGIDSRISGPKLKEYILKTFSSLGAEVLDCGLASTPAMFMSTIFHETNCDGAVMVTASHLPFNRNGFKYFDKDGGLNKSDITEIIQIAEKYLLNSENGSCDSDGTIKNFDLISLYSAHIRELIKKGIGTHAENPQKPLLGMKIVVDAGNGSGGFYADKVLAPLGADISGSCFLEPDGTFPNHIPNPEDKDAINAISSAVVENNADFGLIFDTDVDRSAAVDGNGKPITRNAIVALAAALVAEEHPNTTVVTDSVTSTHLTDFIENELNLKHLRFKRGYKNVINRSIQLNNEGIDSQLAIETSGHAAFKENYFLDDGAYLAAKVVIKATKLKKEGQTLEKLISSLKEPAEEREIRMKINCVDFSDYGKNILTKLEQWSKTHANLGMSLVQPNYEGVRINFDTDNGNGWALVRMSLHDPIMPLNIESDQPGGTVEISKILKQFLSEFEHLDTSAL